jgi:uncharacterized protein YlxW (UPF0749 family)
MDSENQPHHFRLGMKDGIITLFTVVMLSALLVFNDKINDIEVKVDKEDIKIEKINELEKKLEELMKDHNELDDRMKQKEEELYKEYGTAMEYTKRMMESDWLFRIEKRKKN